MSHHERPLSPHLSIYRWPITMTVSILHRATGLGLSAGFIVFCAWLFAATAGPDSYRQFLSGADTVVGRLIFVALSFAFFLHLANGLRHLVWDVGRGFEIRTANASAWFVIIFSVVLTGLFWWVRL